MRLSARPLTLLRSLVIGAVTAGVASLVLPGATALAVGGVVVVGLLVPWARVVATVGALGFIVAGALNVIRGQEVHRYAPGSDWAGAFVHAGNLVWIGMALLLADGVITAFGLRTKRLPGRRAWRAGAGGQAGPDVRDSDGPDGGEGPGGGGGPEDAGGPRRGLCRRGGRCGRRDERTRSIRLPPNRRRADRSGPGRGAGPEPITQTGGPRPASERPQCSGALLGDPAPTPRPSAPGRLRRLRRRRLERAGAQWRPRWRTSATG